MPSSAAPSTISGTNPLGQSVTYTQNGDGSYTSSLGGNFNLGQVTGTLGSSAKYGGSSGGGFQPPASAPSGGGGSQVTYSGSGNGGVNIYGGGGSSSSSGPNYTPGSTPYNLYHSWLQGQGSSNNVNTSSTVAPPTPTPLPVSTPAVNTGVQADSFGTSNDSKNKSLNLNPYWTQVQKQGYTSREVGPNEDPNQVLQGEMKQYGITDPSQVKTVNSGGKIYYQIPFSNPNVQAYAQQQSSPQPAQSTDQVSSNPIMQLFYQALAGSQSQPYSPPDTQSLLNQYVDANALNQQAQQQYQTQANAINAIIQQDQAQQQAQDNLLQQQIKDAAGQQNDTSFQNWLKAREGIAQRGLGNSGFLNDAMVRNQLNNEDKMQGIYNTGMDNIQKNDATYQGDIAKQQAALSQLSPATIFSGLYSTAMKDAAPYVTDQLNAYNNAYKNGQTTNSTLLSAIEKMAPYYMPTADQQATLAQKAYQFGNLSADQAATLSGYMPNGQATMTNLDNQAKNAEQWANILGYGPNGQPTLNANKLAAQIQQWNNMDNIDITKNNISAQSLAEKTSYDQNLISDAQQTIHDTQTNDALNSIKTQLQTLATQMDSYRTNSQQIPQTLTDQYNKLMQQAQSIVTNQQSVNWSGN